MTVYLYAVCAGAACAPDCEGLGGEALAPVRAADLCAVTSAAPTAPSSEQDLWRHERVVETLMAEHDVLPARFGTVLADETAVRDLLVERRDEFAAALERVAGSVELGVRVALDPPAQSNPTRSERPASGTDYLLEVKRTDRRAAEVVERLEVELAPLANDRRVHPRRPAMDNVRCAYLVDRARVESFLERAAEVAERIGYAQLVCTGPWPPYSFVRPQEGA